MSNINRLLYTISMFDPNEMEDDNLVVDDVRRYNELLGNLSQSGKAKYNDLILSVLRYVNSSSEIKNKVYIEISSACRVGSFDTIEDEDSLYLVERISSEDFGDVTPPIKVWRLDTKVVKSMLCRKMHHLAFDTKDMEAVYQAHNIFHSYLEIAIGGIDDTERFNYTSKYYYFMFEFYKRSDCPDPEILNYYHNVHKYRSMCHLYNNNWLQGTVTFSWQIELGKPIEQTIYNINEYCENLKTYAKRLYELNYYADWFRSSCGKGNSSYQEQFKLFARCIVAYDLFNEYVTSEVTIDDKSLNNKIAAVGKKAIRECKEFKDIKKTDDISVRKEFRKDYKNALKLIEQSTQGFISLSDLPPWI